MNEEIKELIKNQQKLRESCEPYSLPNILINNTTDKKCTSTDNNNNNDLHSDSNYELDKLKDRIIALENNNKNYENIISEFNNMKCNLDGIIKIIHNYQNNNYKYDDSNLKVTIKKIREELDITVKNVNAFLKTKSSTNSNKEIDNNICFILENLDIIKNNIDNLPFENQILEINNSLSTIFSKINEISDKFIISNKDLTHLKCLYNNLKNDLKIFKKLVIDDRSNIVSKIVKNRTDHENLKNAFLESLQNLNLDINSNTTSLNLIDQFINNLKNSTDEELVIINERINTISIINTEVNEIIESIRDSFAKNSTDIINLSINTDSKVNILDNKILELINTNSSLNQSIGQNTSNISFLYNSNLTFFNELELLKNDPRFTELASNIVDLVSDISSLNLQYNNLIIDVNNIKNDPRFNQLSGSVNNLLTNISNLTTNQNNMLVDINNIKNDTKVIQLTSDIDNVNIEITMLKNLHDILKTELEILKSNIDEPINDVNTLKTIIDEHTVQLNTYMSFIPLTNNKINNIIARLDVFEDTPMNIISIKNSVTEILASMQSLSEDFEILDGLNDSILQFTNSYSSLEQRIISLEINTGIIDGNNIYLEIKNSMDNINTDLQLIINEFEILENLNNKISDVVNAYASLDERILILEAGNGTNINSDSLLTNKVNMLDNTVSSLQMDFQVIGGTGISSNIQRLKSELEELLNGSMKIHNDYNILTNKYDSNYTSVKDPNTLASLIIGNSVILDSGIKIHGHSNMDTITLGNRVSTKHGHLTLDVKGDSKFDGKINGSHVEDLGRSPKLTTTIDVISGIVSSFPYNGPTPNRLRVMLNGMYEVPLSKTDGYLYSYFDNKINIYPGSSSIGTIFTTSGSITSPQSGSYQINIY
jgi:hypothetical protein